MFQRQKANMNGQYRERRRGLQATSGDTLTAPRHRRMEIPAAMRNPGISGGYTRQAAHSGGQKTITGQLIRYRIGFSRIKNQIDNGPASGVDCWRTCWRKPVTGTDLEAVLCLK